MYVHPIPGLFAQQIQQILTIHQHTWFEILFFGETLIRIFDIFTKHGPEVDKSRSDQLPCFVHLHPGVKVYAFALSVQGWIRV